MASEKAKLTGKEFLQSTEHGQRLLVAEEALRLIEAGELENLKRTVTNAVFAARCINDPTPFQKSSGESASPKELNDASEVTAYLQINLLKIPQATLFYNKKTTGIAEAQLFGTFFPKLIAMAYSAIGLDVERAADLDKNTLEKLLRAGIPKPE